MVKLSRTTFGAFASMALVVATAAVEGFGVTLAAGFTAIFLTGTAGFLAATARADLTGVLIAMIHAF